MSESEIILPFLVNHLYPCSQNRNSDVISTRRLSYILYLPDPAEPWKPEWGGALELYPVEGKHVPSNTPSVVIPPKWNQYTFFAVQPGHSFHSVEEVAHPTKSRLSISGWFHRPQPEEEGYDEADEKREEQERKDHASAEGLLSKEFDAEFTPYSDSLDAPLPGSDLSAEDRKFLAFFLNPLYLQRPNQAALFDRFGDDSHILLADFLNKDFASALEKALKATDGRDQLRWWELDGGREKASVPSHSTGVEGAWTIQGPPHRQRFLALGEASTPAKENPALPASSASEMETDALIEALKGKLLPSPAFRHFLANISQLVPIGARPVQARRFRPGLDYTLARSDEEAVLDVVLDLTPDVGRMAVEAAGVSAPRGLAGKAKKAKTNGAGKTSKIGPKAAKALKEAWQSGESGGWECYMAPNDDESDDPAVYGSGSKREEAESGQGSSGKVNGSVDKEEEDEEEEEEEPVEMELDEDDDGEEEDEEDESGVLLNLTPTFNTLSLVLRDQKVMRFVKYLSASAGGSRWDISAEFEVGAAVVEE